MRLCKTEKAILKAIQGNKGCLPSTELCKLVQSRNAGRTIAYARRLRWKGLLKTREDFLTNTEIERLFVAVFLYPRARVYWIMSDEGMKLFEEATK